MDDVNSAKMTEDVGENGTNGPAQRLLNVLSRELASVAITVFVIGG